MPKKQKHPSKFNKLLDALVGLIGNRQAVISLSGYRSLIKADSADGVVLLREGRVVYPSSVTLGDRKRWNAHRTGVFRIDLHFWVSDRNSPLKSLCGKALRLLLWAWFSET